MHDPAKLEVEFSVFLVRLLRYYNLLELNLGLAIAFMSKSLNSEITPSKLSKMSLETMAHEFSRLTAECKLKMTPTLRRKLEGWSAQIEKTRFIRNSYVHGHWDLLPMKEYQPVTLSAPPWLREKFGLTSRVEMSIGDLQRISENVENVFKDFMEIRQELGL